jgi:hypothetical protein
MQGKHPIDRGLRLGGCPEDETLVVLQFGKPVPDVVGVVRNVRRQSESEAKKCRPNLSHQFFGRIAAGTESAG